MRSRFLILFTTIAGVLSTNAQLAGKTQWDVRFSRELSKGNDTATLVFTGSIPDSQYIYGTRFHCEFGPYPSRLSFENMGLGYILSDSAESVGAYSEFDPVFNCSPEKFAGTAVIRQRIRFSDPQAIIRGSLIYQTCANEICSQSEIRFETEGTRVIKVENSH